VLGISCPFQLDFEGERLLSSLETLETIEPPHALRSVSYKKFAQIVFSAVIKAFFNITFYSIVFTLNLKKIHFMCFLIILVIIKLYNRVIII